MLDQGVSAENIAIEKYVDVRYRGQSYELTVRFDPELRHRFHHIHRQTYGYARSSAPLEFVNIRLRVAGEVESPALSKGRYDREDPSSALMDTRRVIFSAGNLRTPFYQWERLKPGNRLQGPAVIVRDDTTVLVNSDDKVWIDVYNNLVMMIGG